MLVQKIHDLQDHIIDAANKVHAELGAGYEESVYEEAMAVELRSRKINYEVQHNVEIFYQGFKVGLNRLDFIVEKQMVVELKAQQMITKSHDAQTKAYLKTLGLKDALIINFPYPETKEPQINAIKTG